tara:strand:- start:404 stop:805 length:402 start_codon:yes stop_codon:yes gene_type:complete
MNIIKILTVENQENKLIYSSISNFFQILQENFWQKKFLLWELDFFKNIGYDINFNDYVSKKNINGNDNYIVKSTSFDKIIPKFLIEKNSKPVDENDLLIGFKLVGDFLDKTILKPNNINFPTSRIDFLSQIKQ